MLEFVLGTALVIALVCWGNYYQKLQALRNERLEGQESYENLLFSVEREREVIQTTMDRMQNNIEYLQDENRTKSTEVSLLEDLITEITSESKEKS